MPEMMERIFFMDGDCLGIDDCEGREIWLKNKKAGRHYMPSREIVAWELLFEEAVVETLEALTMASFVFGHFVDGVVNGVEVFGFGVSGDAHFIFVGTGFSGHALFEVGLGVPDAVAEEFSKFGGVFGFFKGVALEGFSDFGVTFAVGLTRHCEVHAHFGAFTVEVRGEVFDHLLVAAFGNADFMFGNEFEFGVVVGHFFELACGSAAEGALFGGVFTFVDVATNCADPFLFHTEF